MNNSLLLIWTVKGHQQKRKLKFVFGIAYHTYARAFISLSLHILNDYRQTIHRLVIKLTTTIKLLKQDDTETKIILLANIHSKNICLMSLLKNKYHLKATSKHQSYRMQDMIKIEIDNIYRNILVYISFRSSLNNNLFDEIKHFVEHPNLVIYHYQSTFICIISTCVKCISSNIIKIYDSHQTILRYFKNGHDQQLLQR